VYAGTVMMGFPAGLTGICRWAGKRREGGQVFSGLCAGGGTERVHSGESGGVREITCYEDEINLFIMDW